SYISIGNGPATPGNSLHNPGYDFNDDSLSLGATYWVKLVERFLARPAV
ncbi:amidohydrolase, partial [Enterococcus faecium]